MKLCKIINLQRYKKNKQKRFAELLEMLEPTAIVDSNSISYEDAVKQYEEYYANSDRWSL